MATSRRKPRPAGSAAAQLSSAAQRQPGTQHQPGDGGQPGPASRGLSTGEAAASVLSGVPDGTPAGRGRGGQAWCPPVRLAPREELAASARVAPLLRAASEVARWAGQQRPVDGTGHLPPGDAETGASDLDMTPAEFCSAWRVCVATRMLHVSAGTAMPGECLDVLATGCTDEIMTAWDDALILMLGADDLDGLATALYTVGGPVKMEALFDAYTAAAGSAGTPAADLSAALEDLADLGVVEAGTEELGGGLTVALSRLGVWGIHRYLRSAGWHVPVLGDGARGDATDLLATLANCDVEDGEAEIAAWLAGRPPDTAARELLDAARVGTPGLRGAGFAVLDRIGAAAVPAVREAMSDPGVRAHAAVWLSEHGEETELSPEDRAWLLVDLGAGLLEEADPSDVVIGLLPDGPSDAQAELVAGLWRVDHPAVTDLLTALSQHHPDPVVARAARKAAFKARSPSVLSLGRRVRQRG